jgi:predicted RNA-binding Zn-ribbon protein involved in translation (DUF1610 family)
MSQTVLPHEVAHQVKTLYVNLVCVCGKVMINVGQVSNGEKHLYICTRCGESYVDRKWYPRIEHMVDGKCVLAIDQL